MSGPSPRSATNSESIPDLFASIDGRTRANTFRVLPLPVRDGRKMAAARAVLIGMGLVVTGVSVGVWGVAGIWGASGLTGAAAQRPDAMAALRGDGIAPVPSPVAAGDMPRLLNLENGPHGERGRSASVPVVAPVAPSNTAAEMQAQAEPGQDAGKAKAPTVRRDRKSQTRTTAQGRTRGGREPIARELPLRGRSPAATGSVDADAQVIEAIFTR